MKRTARSKKVLMVLCPCSLKQKCAAEGSEHKLFVYCIEGCFEKATVGAIYQ